jgi:hypothetical protein
MAKNSFHDYEKQISPPKEISLVEQDFRCLSIKLHEDMKAHYLKYNGGTPKRIVWIDESYDYLEVRRKDC